MLKELESRPGSSASARGTTGAIDMEHATKMTVTQMSSVNRNNLCCCDVTRPQGSGLALGSDNLYCVIFQEVLAEKVNKIVGQNDAGKISIRCGSAQSETKMNIVEDRVHRNFRCLSDGRGNHIGHGVAYECFMALNDYTFAMCPPSMISAAALGAAVRGLCGDSPSSVLPTVYAQDVRRIQHRLQEIVAIEL
ncbi:unnamed protein product, partial [Cyprideis torosa]